MGKVTHRLRILWDSMSYDVVLISILWVVLATIKNSADWLVTQTYGDSIEFWETCWQNFLEKFQSYFGKENLYYNLFVYGTWLGTQTLYWGGSMVFLFCDITQIPKFMRKYKTQPGEHEPLYLKTALKVIAVTLLNQIFLQLPFSMVICPVLEHLGLTFSMDLPSFNQFMVDLIKIHIAMDILFFYAHKLGHHPLLYKCIHKIHHEFQAPFAPAANYCHPLEHLVVNMSPVFLSSLLCTSHLITMWAWFLFVTFTTIFDHSGYHLPFSPSPQFHDYHHLKFNECYGSKFGILDSLYGTDEKFHHSVYYKRHRMLFGFKPINEQFPDARQKLKPKQKHHKRG